MWRKKRPLGDSLTCLLFLVTLVDAHEFLSHSAASQVLRWQSKVDYLFKRGKSRLERECIEKLCHREEAREIFEDQPVTSYFYRKYRACLDSHHVGIISHNSPIPSDLRSCVNEIRNDCAPFPCYEEGTERCVDGKASFTCLCKPGWKGPLCQDDIDECSDPEFPAGCNQKCSNVPGSFHCECEEGYFLDDKIHCEDIDECSDPEFLGGCNQKCSNVPGSFHCECEEGYFLVDKIHCVDIDECSDPEFLAGCNQKCSNVPGSFHCECEEGYFLVDKIYCMDIDECSDPEFLGGCNQKCSNVPGSFHCECEEGYFLVDKIHCVDIDECSDPEFLAGCNQKCSNVPGSFHCECEEGYFLVDKIYCMDIDECSDPEFLAGCNQKCSNIPGSFHCECEEGYFLVDKIYCMDVDECQLYPSTCGRPAKCVNMPGTFECHCPLGFKYDLTSRTCSDVDECQLYPSTCGHPAKCVNMPGTFECHCPLGFKYDLTSRTCSDVDECEQNVCDGACVNAVGSYTCLCDGRLGRRLAENGRRCEQIPVCVDLYDHKHSEILYLGEQFVDSLPVIFLRFRLPENTKFAAEFDFRTFDPEGVILYAESSQSSWFMLGLRGGHIEVQFKNQHSIKIASEGKAINDGQWHVVSVDELENSISVKISKEVVMSINSPERLFTPTNGILETRVHIGGLPNRTNNIIKPINPRLDGCIRDWNLMNQGESGVKMDIQEKKSKHCFVNVEPGSFFSGAGLAHFNIDYSASGSWSVDLKMSIRPSTSTGVLFALVYNNTVPLSLAVVTKGDDEANLQVFMDGVSVARLDSLLLCNSDRMTLLLNVTPTKIQISAESSPVTYVKSGALQNALRRLNSSMLNPIRTYVGGIPDDVPLFTTPVTAYYHGCMDITVNGQQLDFDEALGKHDSIKSHSCLPAQN